MKKILRPGKSSLRTWLVSNKIFIIISVILVGLIINELRPLGLSKIAAIIGKSDKRSSSEITTETNVATVIPTDTPTPTMIAFVVPTIDPDPIVNCRKSENCKGGTVKVRLSQCKASVCCQIYKDLWYFFADKQTCDAAQTKFNEMLKARLNTLNQASKATIIYPTLPPLPTFPPLQPIQTNAQTITTMNSGGSADMSFLYRECIKNINNAYTTYMNVLSGYGSAESSMGVQASIERDQGLGECDRRFNR